MSRWLRTILALQVALFAIWGARLATSHRDATTVWLDTEPVDPRDFLSGHYVALRYPIGRAAHDLCAPLVPTGSDQPVYVRLRETEETVQTIDGPVSPSVAVDCRLDLPRDGEPWIRGRPSGAHGMRTVQFGIERFYVPESSDLRHTRSGDVVAGVTLNAAGDGRISRLVSRAPTILP